MVLATILVACGSETNESVEITPQATEEQNLVEVEETNEAPAGIDAQDWQAFVDEYDAGSDATGANTTLDGQSVTISGLINKMMEYQDQEGTQAAQACIGPIGDDVFAHHGVLALFPMDLMESLNTAQASQKKIYFTGTVQKRSFGEIIITDCKLH